MSDKSKFIKARWVLAVCLLTLSIWSLIVGVPRPTQENEANDDEGTKDIKRVFREARINRHSKPKPNPDKPSSVKDGLIGITIWRLRPPNGAKELKHPVQVAGFIPESVDLATPLSNGDRVRLTIEVPREGFLYVVDREQYADATFGNPLLIFPTKRIHGGNNRVAPGSPIGLPDLEDNPPYFELDRSRPDQVAETLSVLMTPKPIEGFPIGLEARRLSKEEFELWKQWETEARQIKLGKAGELQTEAENNAEADTSTEGTKALRHPDPLPQTVLVATKPGKSIMVTVPLRIGR